MHVPLVTPLLQAASSVLPPLQHLVRLSIPAHDVDVMIGQYIPSQSMNSRTWGHAVSKYPSFIAESTWAKPREDALLTSAIAAQELNCILNASFIYTTGSLMYRMLNSNGATLRPE